MIRVRCIGNTIYDDMSVHLYHNIIKIYSTSEEEYYDNYKNLITVYSDDCEFYMPKELFIPLSLSEIRNEKIDKLLDV